jgi:hypothetical protein
MMNRKLLAFALVFTSHLAWFCHEQHLNSIDRIQVEATTFQPKKKRKLKLPSDPLQLFYLVDISYHSRLHIDIVFIYLFPKKYSGKQMKFYQTKNPNGACIR